MDAKRVFDQALQLPADIRAALASELLASLEGAEVDPDREALWAAEIRRRVDAYERGEVRALPADQVLAELKALALGYVIDEPAQLPEGAEVELVVVAGDELDERGRAALHASLDRALDDEDAGRFVDTEKFLAEVDAGT